MMTAKHSRRKPEAFCRGMAVLFLACLTMTFSACEDRPTRDAIDQHAGQSRQSLGQRHGRSAGQALQPSRRDR